MDKSGKKNAPTAASSRAALSRLFAAMAVFDAVFLTFLMFGAWNNRLAADDFGYLAQRNAGGVWGGAVWFWQHWTGRFGASLLIGGMGGMASANGGRLFVYTASMAAFLITALSFFLARLWARFDVPLRLGRALTLGTFAFALLVLGTRSMGEVWFWLAGSATYAWPFGLLFFALGLLLPLKPRPFASAGASVLLSLVPFFNDSLAILLLPFLAWQIWANVRNPSNPAPLVRRITQTPVFVPLLCCAASWVFCSLAPGQKIRIAAGGGLHFSVAFKMTLLSLVRGGGYLLLKHGHLFLLAFLVGLAFGAARQTRPGFVLIARPLVWRRVRVTAALLLGVALLTFLPSVLAYGFVVDRVYVYLSVALVAASFLLGMLFGQSEMFPVSPRRTEDTVAVFVLLGAVALGGWTIWTGRTMANYARAYDARYALLLRLRTAQTVSLPPVGQAVDLEPLPPPGPLYDTEILHSSRHWVNVALQEGLGLPRPVRKAGKGIDPVR